MGVALPARGGPLASSSSGDWPGPSWVASLLHVFPSPALEIGGNLLISSQDSPPLRGTDRVPTGARHCVGVYMTTLGRALALHFLLGYRFE